MVLRRPLVIKGGTLAFAFLSKETRLGELYTLILCLILIGMIIRVPYTLT